MGKKHIAVLLLLALCASLLAGCGSGDADAAATVLRFNSATDIEEINTLNGRKVTIDGYMATMSPVSGKFMYLMNLPYQSCPFCVPNTTELANTMAVYAPEGKKFGYTEQAIRVTGTMQTGDFVDEYGYVYNYRIVDATYEEIDLSQVSEQYALWQAIAADGLVNAVNDMLNYLHFVSQWTEYTSGYVDEGGNQVVYYLYPGDVELYLQDTGVYGYADKADADYFPGLLRRIRAIDPEKLEDLAAIVTDAQEAEALARAELADQNFTYDPQEDKYTLNNSEELYNRWNDLWLRFSEWLTRWEIS